MGQVSPEIGAHLEKPQVIGKDHRQDTAAYTKMGF
jgi:hypothetical protein